MDIILINRNGLLSGAFLPLRSCSAPSTLTKWTCRSYWGVKSDWKTSSSLTSEGRPRRWRWQRQKTHWGSLSQTMELDMLSSRWTSKTSWRTGNFEPYCGRIILQLVSLTFQSGAMCFKNANSPLLRGQVVLHHLFSLKSLRVSFVSLLFCCLNYPFPITNIYCFERIISMCTTRMWKNSNCFFPPRE